jgi:hypothetical protein
MGRPVKARAPCAPTRGEAGETRNGLRVRPIAALSHHVAARKPPRRRPEASTPGRTWGPVRGCCRYNSARPGFHPLRHRSLFSPASWPAVCDLFSCRPEPRAQPPQLGGEEGAKVSTESRRMRRGAAGGAGAPSSPSVGAGTRRPEQTATGLPTAGARHADEGGTDGATSARRPVACRAASNGPQASCFGDPIRTW